MVLPNVGFTAWTGSSPHYTAKQTAPMLKKTLSPSVGNATARSIPGVQQGFVHDLTSTEQ